MPAGHKYISRKKVGGKYVYTYPEDKKGRKKGQGEGLRVGYGLGARRGLKAGYRAGVVRGYRAAFKRKAKAKQQATKAK